MWRCLPVWLLLSFASSPVNLVSVKRGLTPQTSASKWRGKGAIYKISCQVYMPCFHAYHISDIMSCLCSQSVENTKRTKQKQIVLVSSIIYDFVVFFCQRQKTRKWAEKYIAFRTLQRCLAFVARLPIPCGSVNFRSLLLPQHSPSAALKQICRADQTSHTPVWYHYNFNSIRRRCVVKYNAQVFQKVTRVVTRAILVFVYTWRISICQSALNVNNVPNVLCICC